MFLLLLSRRRAELLREWNIDDLQLEVAPDDAVLLFLPDLLRLPVELRCPFFGFFELLSLFFEPCFCFITFSFFC